MRIAILTCVFPPYRGGIGNAAFRQAQILSELGHEVTVFTLLKGDGQNFYSFGVVYLNPVIKYGNAGFAFSILKYLKNFDLIWLHYPFIGTHYILYFFLLFNRTKLFIYYHMDLSLEGFFRAFNFIERIFFPFLARRAQKIFVSSYDYFKTGPFAYLFDKRFCELPLGVDTGFFVPEFEKKRDNVLLFVGALDKAHYFKGVEVLLEAFKKVLIKKPEAILKIVGDGEMRDYYKNRAASEGIADKVEFLGGLSSEELRKQYQSASVLILPSLNRGEAFGLVLVEAMACGTPVIASNIPGVRTVVSDEVGALVEPGNVKELIRVMGKFLGDKILRIKTGHAGVQAAREKYDISVHKQLIKDFLG